MGVKETKRPSVAFTLRMFFILALVILAIASTSESCSSKAKDCSVQGLTECAKKCAQHALNGGDHQETLNCSMECAEGCT